MNNLNTSFRMVRVLGLLMLTLCTLQLDSYAQKISTSPTRINFKVAPGASGRGKMTVTNNSNARQRFQVTFGDFKANPVGRGEFLDKGEVDRSCAEWLSASPAVFEIDPGEKQDVTVLLDAPADSSAMVARWAVAYVRLAPREIEGKEGEGLIVRVNQSYRFAVYMFQTPPNALAAKGEILGLDYENDVFTVEIKNVGETFLRCNSYVEFTSLSTGQTQRVATKGFTILPTGHRYKSFDVPKDLPPGRYSVLAVLDYGNRDEVEAAEMEIMVPEKGNDDN